MIKSQIKILFLALASLLVTVSCAKDVSETSEEVQRRILDSYLRVHNYQDIEPLDDGLYIIDSIGGRGEQVKDSCFLYIRYSVRYFSGDYNSTTYDSVAKLLGNYKVGNYYGTYVWAVGNGTLLSPIEKILLSMRVGGKTTSILPPWLTSTSTGDASYSVSYTSTENCLLYDIEVVDMTLDIDQRQIDDLEKFSEKYYGGLDSTKKGYYFLKTFDSGYKDTIAEGASISVDYIGRLLDGSIFDTNVKDTAKKYRIYDASNSYSGLSLTVEKDSAKIAEGSSSVVKGFATAVASKEMTFGDKCITFFNSTWGYGESGSIKSGKGVPGYTPMFFEIWIHEKDDD